MKIYKSYRYELKPNNKQRGLFIKACGISRFVWNWGLARRKELYRARAKEGEKRFTNVFAQQRELNALKKTVFPWMYEVSQHILEITLKNLDLAYGNYYRGLKTKEDIGLPKFKKKGKLDSFTVRGERNSLRVETIGVRLPRIGLVRTKELTDKLKGKICYATVSREADRWFGSLCVEQECSEPTPIQGDIVGIDLGINSFATIWDGKQTQKIEAPKPLAKRLKKIKRLHRQQDKKQKGSNNQKKAALRLSRTYSKTRNIRKDFLAKLTSLLAKTKSVIIIEDLNVQGMSHNHRLARSINDVGWGGFRQMLEYKTEWYGSRLIKIGRFEPTSKMCHVCGAINKDLDLNDRTWVCPNCGAVLDRDENAAINIRRLGLEILYTESISEINACGECVRLPSLGATLVEAGSKQNPMGDKTYGTGKDCLHDATYSYYW